MHRRSALLIAMVTLWLTAPAFSSGTYKCTSPSGDIQYTAVPPKGAGCEPFMLRKKTAPAPAPTKTRNAPAGEEPAAQAPANGDFERIARENCKKSRVRLTTLTSNPRVRIKEGNKYRVLSEEERQQKIRLAEQQVEEYCN